MLFSLLDNPQRTGYVCAILAMVMFGSVSTLAKPLVSTVNPFLLSAVVYLISAITLTPLTVKSPIKTSSKKDILLILVVSLCGAVIAPSLYFVGLNHASASDAALLSNGEGLFTVLVAMLIFKEKVKKIGYVAIPMIFVGLFIVSTDLQISAIPEIHFEDMLIIIAMGFWAIDNNLSRILTKRLDIAIIAQIKSLIGGLLLLAISILVINVPLSFDPTQIVPVLLLGIFGFAMSLYFFLQALKRIATIRTAMVFSLSPVVGMIAAYFVLSESIDGLQILAAIIMMFGVYLLNRK